MHPIARDTRVVLIATLVLLALVASSCRSYLPVRGHELRPTTPVQVRLVTPRSLTLVPPAGDTVSVRGVQELTGEVTRSSGDTLEIQVRSINRRPPPQADARVTIAPVAGDRVDALRFSPGKSLGMVAVLFGAAIGAVFIAFLFLPNPS